nr:MAG: ORF3 [Rhipicephalus associated rhabdo-like virus]
MLARLRNLIPGSSGSQGESSGDDSSSRDSHSPQPDVPRGLWMQVNFDINARLTIRMGYHGMSVAALMRMGQFFHGEYQGEAHARSLTAFIVGLMTLRSYEDPPLRGRSVRRAIFQDIISLEGPPLLLPLSTAEVFRDTFYWRYRGEMYVWSITVDRAPTIFTGQYIEQLIQPHERETFGHWGVQFVNSTEHRHLIPVPFQLSP